MLSYHEKKEGILESFWDDGRGRRTKEYYVLGMGGTIVNAIKKVPISYQSPLFFTENPLEIAADIAISTANIVPETQSVDITVTVNAKADIPAGTVMYLMAKETRTFWSDYETLLGGPLSNGQTYITDFVYDILTDSLGDLVSIVGDGESETFTYTLTSDTNFINLDSVRLTAFLQVYDTKQIIAVNEFIGPDASGNSPSSPYNKSLVGTISESKNGFNVSGKIAISRSAGNLRFTIPQESKNVAIFNAAGVKISSNNLSGYAKGAKVSIAEPEANGIYFLKIVTNAGSFYFSKLIIQ